MYPAEELSELQRRKAELRGRIAVNRQACVAQAGAALRPLVWIDQVMDRWRRAAPLVKMAAVPVGWLLWQKLRRRGAALGATTARWLPTLLGVVRAVGAMRRF